MQFINKTNKRWFEFWKPDVQVTLYGMELDDKEFVKHLKTYSQDFPSRKKNFSVEMVLENNANVIFGERCRDYLENRFAGYSVVTLNYKNSIL